VVDETRFQVIPITPKENVILMDHTLNPLTKIDSQEKIFDLMNKSLPILIGAFIFFRPIQHVTALEEISFYSAVAITVFLVLLRKMEFSFKSPLTFPFVAFAAWALLGIFFAINRENSLHDFYAHLLKYLAFFYIVVNVFNTEKRFQLLSWIIVLSAGALSYGGIAYVYGIQGYSFSERFVNPAYFPYREFIYVFATLAAFNIIFGGKSLFQRIILLLCLVGTIGATLLTQNRGALIALSISILILFINKRRDLVALVALIVVSILLLSPFSSRFKDVSVDKNYRIGTQLLYVEVIKDHPIIGIGFGMQTYTDKRLLLEKYNSRVSDTYRQNFIVATPHNTILDIATRVGIVGLALYFWIIAAFLRMNYQMIRHGKNHFIKEWGLCLFAAFIAFFIQAVFHDATYGVQVIVQYLIFAMGTILWRLNMQKELSSNG